MRPLQADPVGLGPDVNEYRAVGNNPTNATDPSGLAMVPPYKGKDAQALGQWGIHSYAPRVFGVIQMGWAAAEAYAAAPLTAAPEPTLTKAAAWVTIVDASDNAASGFHRVIFGDPEPRSGIAEGVSGIAKTAGVDPQTANGLGGGAKAVTSGVGLAVGVYQGAGGRLATLPPDLRAEELINAEIRRLELGPVPRVPCDAPQVGDPNFVGPVQEFSNRFPNELADDMHTAEGLGVRPTLVTGPQSLAELGAGGGDFKWVVLENGEIRAGPRLPGDPIKHPVLADGQSVLSAGQRGYRARQSFSTTIRGTTCQAHRA